MRQFKMITVRPITDDQMATMVSFLGHHSWASINGSFVNTDLQLELLTNKLFILLDTIAPSKVIKIACDDPPWMNKRIKTMIRKRNREFDKSGKTSKWKSLKTKCIIMCKKAKVGFAQSFGNNLRQSDPKTWMAKMKIL